MREARFEFQGSDYYMRLTGSLLLIIDGVEIQNRKMKSYLIQITDRYNLKSGTHTHSRARAIFNYLETKPLGRGLKILPL